MNDLHGDDSDHVACDECGLCEHCGDCRCKVKSRRDRIINAAAKRIVAAFNPTIDGRSDASFDNKMMAETYRGLRSKLTFSEAARIAAECWARMVISEMIEEIER